MPVGNLARSCRYILASGQYCGNPVEYHMAWDGGELDTQRIREYEVFCQYHKAVVSARRDDEDDE